MKWITCDQGRCAALTLSLCRGIQTVFDILTLHPANIVVTLQYYEFKLSLTRLWRSLGQQFVVYFIFHVKKPYNSSFGSLAVRSRSSDPSIFSSTPAYSFLSSFIHILPPFFSRTPSILASSVAPTSIFLLSPIRSVRSSYVTPHWTL